MSGPVIPGFFGKLPIRGDFLSEGLQGGIQSSLDDALQASVVAGQSHHGELWQAHYFNAPVWRFAWSCPFDTAQHAIGLILPSADSVGRHYPFCVIWQCAADIPIGVLASAAESLLADCELALLDVLYRDSYELEAVRSVLLEQCFRPEPLNVSVLNPTVRSQLGRGTLASALALSLEESEGPGRLAYWWSGGTEAVPATSAYQMELGLDWLWCRAIEPADAEQRPPVSDGHPNTGPGVSLAVSWQGERDANEDRVVCQPERGLWAVIDGMGGHSDGAYAAERIRRRLSEVVLDGDLEDRIAAIKACLRQAHDHLVGYGASIGELCGAAVAIVVADDNNYAVLWAGDVRLYESASNGWSPLTKDHTLIGGELTAAVGVGEVLELPVERFGDRSGDWLLCSDGFYNVVLPTIPSCEALHGLLASNDVQHWTGAERLRLKDNATAILIPAGEVARSF